MSNYRMEYGYASILEPKKMFKEREDAQAFDVALASERLEGVERRGFGESIDGDADNDIIVAMKLLVAVHEDRQSERRLVAYRKNEAQTSARVNASIEAQQIAAE